MSEEDWAWGAIFSSTVAPCSPGFSSTSLLVVTADLAEVLGRRCSDRLASHASPISPLFCLLTEQPQGMTPEHKPNDRPL